MVNYETESHWVYMRTRSRAMCTMVGDNTATKPTTWWGREFVLISLDLHSNYLQLLLLSLRVHWTFSWDHSELEPEEVLNRLMAIGVLKHAAILHCKQTIIIPILFASKQQKCSRGCPNICFKSGVIPSSFLKH